MSDKITTEEIKPLFGMEWVDSLLRACHKINEDKPEHQAWIDEARARLAEHDVLKLDLGLTAEQLIAVNAENEDLREKRDLLKAEVERLKERLKNTETWWRNAPTYAARLLKQRDGLRGSLAQWKARAAKEKKP